MQWSRAGLQGPADNWTGGAQQTTAGGALIVVGVRLVVVRLTTQCFAMAASSVEANT